MEFISALPTHAKTALQRPKIQRLKTGDAAEQRGSQRHPFDIVGTMNTVLVRGDGVAAYCCAHLLEQAGIAVALDRPDRPRLPALMLSESALALIADTFGNQDLFRDLPRIRTRVVLWGSGA